MSTWVSHAHSIIPDKPHNPPEAGERVFVTGGSGFIGTSQIAASLAEGTPVANFDKRPPRIPSHRSVWTEGDIRDLKSLTATVLSFEPTIVLHLAARTDLQGKSVSDYSSNVLGVEHLIAATKGLPEPPIVIFASSRLVCEIGYVPRDDTDWRPSTAYGESKVRGEQIVRKQCLHAPWIIVRPTSIWGPWFEAPYRNFFEAVLAGRYMHPRGRKILKSFGYVENSVHQLLQLGRAPTDAITGRVLYLADYEPLELGEFAGAIAREGGASGVRTIPVSMLRLVAGAGDIVHHFGWREPPLTSFRLNNLLTEMVFDLEPMQATTGELPVDWTEGVRRTVRWLQGER